MRRRQQLVPQQLMLLQVDLLGSSLDLMAFQLVVAMLLLVVVVLLLVVLVEAAASVRSCVVRLGEMAGTRDVVDCALVLCGRRACGAVERPWASRRTRDEGARGWYLGRSALEPPLLRALA